MKNPTSPCTPTPDQGPSCFRYPGCKGILTIAIGVLILAGAALLSRPDHVAAQSGRAGVRYEYMMVELNRDHAVAHSGEQEIQIHPPSGTLSKGIQGPSSPSDTQYTLRTMSQRHPGVGALNRLGAEGWEAFASNVDAQGLVTMWMRRAM